MPIQVKCSNIVRYDPATGQYVHCNKRLNVDESRLGTTVECPKCGGMVEVIAAEPAELPTGKSDDLEIMMPLSGTGPGTPRKDLPASHAPRESDEPVSSRYSSPLDDDDQPPLPSSQQAPSWTLAAPPRAAEHTVKSQAPCINCHAQMDRDAPICPACGYLQPDDDVPGQEKGFQGWMQGQLAEGTSPMSVMLLVAFLGGLFLFSCVAYSLITFGGRSILLIIPFIIVALAFAIIVVVFRRRDEPWPAAIRRIGHPWTLLLLANRTLSWRDIRPPFAARLVLDRRDTPLADKDLLAVDGLGDYEVLDLEGTQLTDQSILNLRQTTKLKFLVVLRTATTPAAVRKLQNAKPSLWIWH